MIDHANVACGFHAGDPLIMQETVRTCKRHHIAVGAHPGLPDIQGFGRREMKLSPDELTAMVFLPSPNTRFPIAPKLRAVPRTDLRGKKGLTEAPSRAANASGPLPSRGAPSIPHS